MRKALSNDASGGIQQYPRLRVVLLPLVGLSLCLLLCFVGGLFSIEGALVLFEGTGSPTLSRRADPPTFEKVMLTAHHQQSKSPPMFDHFAAAAYRTPFDFTYHNDTKDVLDAAYNRSLRELRDIAEPLIEGKLPPLTKERASVFADDRRPAAVLTLVRNEPVCLRAWVNHYNKTFLPGDMYILDNNMGRDGTMRPFKAQGVNVFPAECDGYFADHRCTNGIVNEAVNMLLKAYKTVVYTDVDELIYSAKVTNQSLWEYLCDLDVPTVRVSTRTPMDTPNPNATAFAEAGERDNFALSSVSPPFNWNPIVEEGGGFMAAYQREYWFEDRVYRKPLITQVPLVWEYGWHEARHVVDLAFDPITGRVRFHEFVPRRRIQWVTYQDPDIIMLHTHRIDKRYYIEKAKWKSRQKKVDRDLGSHAFFGGKAAEDFYWEHRKDLQPIPEWWKGVEERHLSQRPTGLCIPRIRTKAKRR